MLLYTGAAAQTINSWHTVLLTVPDQTKFIRLVKVEWNIATILRQLLFGDLNVVLIILMLLLLMKQDIVQYIMHIYIYVFGITL